MKKLIQFIPTNLDKHLYETKSKNLEKLQDKAIMYHEEDDRIEILSPLRGK